MVGLFAAPALEDRLFANPALPTEKLVVAKRGAKGLVGIIDRALKLRAAMRVAAIVPRLG
jgi:hypothetical protein